MPSKYVVRKLREDGVYHVYNCGSVDKGLFIESQDYRVFLFYLYIYTSPTDKLIEKFSDLPTRLREKTLVGKLEIVAYTLFSDHFHLVIHLHSVDSMAKLMKQVVNGYTTYYNLKYKHKGPVFMGRYKAVEVEEALVLGLVRYIHNEPIDEKYEWSSYRKYLGEDVMLDCDTRLIMSKVGTLEELVKYHADVQDYEEKLEGLKSLLIEIT